VSEEEFDFLFESVFLLLVSSEGCVGWLDHSKKRKTITKREKIQKEREGAEVCWIEKQRGERQI
jgi:hypothetical protein